MDFPLQVTPLDALHGRLGGRMVPFAGYRLPVQYDEGVMAEHLWTRAQASLFDVSHMGQIRLTGPAVDRALETLVPGDIVGLKPGRLRYTLLLNEAGGIMDDLIVARRLTEGEEELFLIVNGACKAADLAHIVAHLGADCVDAQFDRALLAVQGPQAAAVLCALVPDLAGLTFMTGMWATLAGVRAWVTRSGYTGEDGFEIALAAGDAETVAQALLADARVKPAGLGARDALRLEAGLPLYGQDLSPDITPVEAGLTFALAQRRRLAGDYPGANVLARQMQDGPARQRVGLRLEGKAPARAGALIFAPGGLEAIGVVTSGGFGPSVNGPVALGLVQRGFASDSQRLEIDVRGRRLSAVVSATPFVPHRYVRIR